MSKSATTPWPVPGTPGRVTFLDGQGDLPMIEVVTTWSTAEIYFQGAQVTHFQKHTEPPLLFLSQCSRFVAGSAIRGGVPLIFPWFGPREGMPQHGFARIKPWDLKEIQAPSDGSVSLRFEFPECPEALTFPPFKADYTVTVRDSLEMCLRVRNESAEEVLPFENCLHTYLAVSDIAAMGIHGLKGASYIDSVGGVARRQETEDPIRIASEVDRVYVDSPVPVRVCDSRLGRCITVAKSGSNSTVLWNPWTVRAQQMPDFGNEEYTAMVCVESGNVAPNELKIGPGQEAVLRVNLSSAPLE